VTHEQPTDRSGRPWGGRVATILILAFIGVVLALMFFAARGPR
jgi:hypothetical protein